MSKLACVFANIQRVQEFKKRTTRDFHRMLENNAKTRGTKSHEVYPIRSVNVSSAAILHRGPKSVTCVYYRLVTLSPQHLWLCWVTHAAFRIRCNLAFSDNSWRQQWWWHRFSFLFYSHLSSLALMVLLLLPTSDANLHLKRVVNARMNCCIAWEDFLQGPNSYTEGQRAAVGRSVRMLK